MKQTPLVRRTPLRSAPKGKGNRGEREVVDILRATGWPTARRNFASGGEGGNDIIGGPAGLAIEVKRTERLRLMDAWRQVCAAAQPTEMPAVVHRCNNSPWLVTIEFDELIALLRLREQGA